MIGLGLISGSPQYSPLLLIDAGQGGDPSFSLRDQLGKSYIITTHLRQWRSILGERLISNIDWYPSVENFGNPMTPKKGGH